MKEIWRDVKGFNGKYKISNLGNVKSFNNYNNISNGRLMKFNIRQGYSTVQLSNQQHRHSYQVHRLVAEAFIPNPNNYPFVNHIDENRKNNNINNLEWCTQKMNVNHSKHKMCKLKSVVSSSTGEKYITIKTVTKSSKNKTYTYKLYRVNIPKIHIDKVFKDFAKALNYRNSCILELNKYYNI